MFSSSATNLVPGDSNGLDDVFIVPTNPTSSGSSSSTSTSPLLSNLSGVSLSSAAAARSTMDLLSRYESEISSLQGTLGAAMYRLQVGAQNLGTLQENYSAADSRIVDTDVAFESSKVLRANILQQTGAAVLAQANQQPTIALQLLRG